MNSILNIASEYSGRGESFYIVTLMQARGSAPQEIGAKAIITKGGLVGGTIGGGKLEAFAIKHILGNFKDESHLVCELRTINLQRDIGMSCGGEVTLSFEYFCKPKWNIAIFGAGHVSQALCRILQTLPCSIQVFDTRIEWIEKLPRAANIEARVVESLSSIASLLPKDTFVVVMTQGHATDFPVLDAVLKINSQAYIGVLGSSIKSSKIRSELISAGHPKELVETLHCPIGLNLGRNTPEEMAISISAELLKERDLLAAANRSEPSTYRHK